MLDAFSEWLRAGRRNFTWIYCSSLLFPLAFALVAAAVLAARGAPGGPVVERFFAIFYLALMVTLASIPRSVLPILLVWLVLIRFRPGIDANRTARYLGLLAMMLAAVYVQSKLMGRGFNWQWLAIGWLCLALPRLALPSLRGGLREPAA